MLTRNFYPSPHCHLIAFSPPLHKVLVEIKQMKMVHSHTWRNLDADACQETKMSTFLLMSLHQRKAFVRACTFGLDTQKHMVALIMEGMYSHKDFISCLTRCCCFTKALKSALNFGLLGNATQVLYPHAISVIQMRHRQQSPRNSNSSTVKARMWNQTAE